MKKILLLMIALLVAVVSFAQKQRSPLLQVIEPSSVQFKPVQKVSKISLVDHLAKTDAASIHRNWSKPVFTMEEPAAQELVVLPEGVEAEEYTLTLYGATSQRDISTIGTKLVAFDGNDVYVQGLAYYFPDSFVKGTLNAQGQYAFKSGQLVGEDQYGKEYLIGVSIVNINEFAIEDEILFDFDAETGVLSLVEGTYYAESGKQDEPNLWDIFSSATYTPGAYVKPDVVELPEGVEVETWYISASTNSRNLHGQEIGVAFDGSDIYLQGLCSYLPDALVKGTIAGDKATFPSGQFYGTFNDTYNLFFVGSKKERKVCDIEFDYDAEAGTLTNDSQVICLCVNGSDLSSTYESMYDIEITRNQQAGPVEAPEGLETETYAFSGYKLEYSGLDRARNAQNVVVGTDDADTVTFDFNAMDVDTSDNNGSTAGDITNPYVVSFEDVLTLTISPKTNDTKTENRFWSTDKGPQLRVYSGTLTFEVPEGNSITQIVFDTAKWNANNTADSGEFSGATWTGNAQTVVVTIAGNTQINNIEVAIESEGGGLNMEAFTNQVQVGFDGDDAYIQGIAADCPELWVKATKNEAGQYVIPANQFMGTLDVGGLGWFYFDYYFTAVDEEENLKDVVLNYDAETQTFSTDQMLALNGDSKSLYYYELYSNVTITKIQEFASKPADPSVKDFQGTSSYPKVLFDIPLEDVDGNELLASKLSYVIWIEKDGVEQPLTLEASLYESLEEDMTEIPYTFSDDWDIYAYGSFAYLNQGTDEIKTWTKIGVQSIYHGQSEENKSNIGWFDLEKYWLTTGIASVKTDGKNSIIFDLQGRRVTQPSKGLYFVDGKKVVIK